MSEPVSLVGRASSAVQSSQACCHQRPADEGECGRGHEPPGQPFTTCGDHHRRRGQEDGADEQNAGEPTLRASGVDGQARPRSLFCQAGENGTYQDEPDPVRDIVDADTTHRGPAPTAIVVRSVVVHNNHETDTGRVAVAGPGRSGMQLGALTPCWTADSEMPAQGPSGHQTSEVGIGPGSCPAGVAPYGLPQNAISEERDDRR